MSYGPYVTLDELPPLPGDTIQLSDLLLARRLDKDYRFTGAILKSYIEAAVDQIYPIDLEIGTVTTLPFGQPASVTLVEYSPARFRVSFGIPTGQDGNTNPEVFYQSNLPAVSYAALLVRTGQFPSDPELVELWVNDPN